MPSETPWPVHTRSMHNSATLPKPRTQSRRPNRPSTGFLYIAVLFTTLIVMASVAAALSISTSNLRGETGRSTRGDALRLAESEIHRQAALMRTSSLWRTGSTHNLFSSWQSTSVDGVPIAGTQVRHRFFDSDALLDDDPLDPVELTVHAKIDRSEAAITVQLESDPIPLDLLRYSVTAADDIRFDGGTLSCERPVQVSDDCRTSTWGILTTPQLECSGLVEMRLRGDLAASSVTLPSQDVVAIYVARGTEIPTLAIPRVSSDLVIQDVVLSPTANPFGANDPSGIYWIDAGGSKVCISHCRLDATLAIRNASRIEVQGGVVWGYPTIPDVILAADSSIVFQDVEATLDETLRSVNFNPASSPYRQTLSNATATDVYPTEIRGVIYTSGNVRLNPLVSNACLRVTGTIVCWDLRIDGYMQVTQLDELLSQPPLGLSDPTPMRFVRGTYRRIPSP